MLPREIKEQNGDFKRMAVGTGAFMVKSFKENQEAVMERNPSYYEMGTDGKALPYLDLVRSVHFSDYTAEIAALRTNQIDHFNYFGVRRIDATELQKSNPKMRHYEQAQFAAGAVWLDPNKKPWDDVRVRRAISLAINRDDFISVERGGALYTGFIPAALKDFAWSQEKLREKFKPNPAEAKKLLADAGYGPASPITVRMDTATINTTHAEVIQQQLEAVGMKVNINIVGQSFSPSLQKRDFEFGYGVAGGGTSVGIWIDDQVYSKSTRNYSLIRDPRVDVLAEAQRRESDPVKRKAIIDQEQDLLYDILPHIPTVSLVYDHFYSCRLRNAPLVTPNYNPITVMHAWIDETGC